MLATIENMRAYYRTGSPSEPAPNVFAYSPITGEEYSANPADYWNVPPGWTMKDADGEPMILVTRQTTLIALKPETGDTG